MTAATSVRGIRTWSIVSLSRMVTVPSFACFGRSCPGGGGTPTVSKSKVTA